MTKRWNYSGDVSLSYGGFFWKEDGQDDYVLCVDVIPVSDAGGPDNVFCIEVGSIYLPADKAKRASALSCIGSDVETATRADLVHAFKCYAGMDRDSTTVVRFGPPIPCGREGWNPKPDVILRANASLKNYVRKHHLD